MTQQKKHKISLLDLKKRIIQETKNTIKLKKPFTLVEQIPLSCAGFVKTDRHYITAQGLSSYSQDIKICDILQRV